MYYRRLLPAIVAAAFLLVFAGCKRHAVVLSYTNAKGEIPLLGNLVFRFNQSMVSDSMLNNWDSTDYVSFEPAISGRFRWESPDQLVFSPSQPLAPATTYKATVKKTVLKFSKYDKVEKGDKIDFHTPDLVLDNSRVVWMGESSTTAVPQVDMLFNYRVSPAAVQEALKVEIDGKPAEVSMITASPENKISFRISGLKLEDKDYSARITLAKGLKPEQGNNATDEVIAASLSIPSPFVLTVQQVEAEHDGTEGYVRVMTSQQVTSEGLRQHIKFNPEVAYTVEATDNGFQLRSDKFDLEKSYMLTLNKGLRGKIGGVLKEEYNQGVAFGELEADISFTNNKAVYLSRNGGKNLEVKITNVPKVKLVISKIYENNLIMAQYYGYTPREKQPSYASYEDGDYYYDDSYDTRVSFGDVIYEKEIDTRSLPRSGGGRLLNLGQFEDRLADFKGIYHVRIRSLEDYWVSDSRFISMSDLGLIAKEGTDKLYVFANSIKTATPVQGVTISVYSNNNQLIGTGASNAEGVAEIAYAKKEFSGFKPAMIIAKTADDFNYMPLRNTRVNTSRFEVGGRRN
ncbi:MAG TPA: hypothetical protein PKC69_15040, partial [Chitinophagaceae bacterium]|nr:hypothetical protein [Chitinophagaceae bacterium]